MLCSEEDMEILHHIVSFKRSKSGQSMTTLLENKKMKNNNILEEYVILKY